MFFTAFVLCILRLFKLKTEGQKILTNLTAKFLSYPGLALLGLVLAKSIHNVFWGKEYWILGLI